MAPLPQVHAERGCQGDTDVPSLGLEDDPVLSALQRYRDAAGSTFHPLSEVEEPDEVTVDSGTSRFVVATTPAFASDCTPKRRSPMITENLSNFEEDFRHVVCGLASVDLGELLPSWISWMNPWLEPTAPDLCGAVSQSGHLQSTASAAWSSASFGSAASPRIETGQEECVESTASSRGPPVPFSPPTSQVLCRTRGNPTNRRREEGATALEAIRELPHGLRSSTFDELLIPDLEAVQAWPPLPDFSAGINLGATFADYCEGWGIGKVCEAKVQGAVGGGNSTEMLVVQLRLNTALNAGQLRRLGASLRRSSTLPQRNDLACALGAVTAGDMLPGVWIIWERPGSEPISPLPEVLQKPQSMDWRLKVARHLCLSLDALHRSGQEHGSLAPRNVLVTKDGEVSLMEQGLVNTLLEVEALREHDLLGAMGLAFARYLPPEGWHVPRSGGMAADIFALGLVLLEVLDASGIPNPECKSLQQLSAKMLPKRGQWQPQVKKGPYDELPLKTRQVIESCVSPNPKQRPSAQELLFSLAAPKEDVDASWYLKEPSMLLSSMSDGMKSGSTGTGSARSQDLEVDLAADLPEEPILKTLTQAPRHMSWPAGVAEAAGMELMETLSGTTCKHLASQSLRAFSADVDYLKPLPPPPPQPEVKVKHLPPAARHPPSRASPRSPGPPLPPPPPAVNIKDMGLWEAISDSEPSLGEESTSRPPSPPRFPLEAEMPQDDRSGHHPWQTSNACECDA